MRRWLPRLGLALAGVVVALLAAEAAVRLLDLGPSFQVVHREVFQLSENPVLGYELKPGAPDGDRRISSAGLRDREYQREKPAGVFRILALGDSVTFGQPRKPETCWPEHLERLLATLSTGTSFEVLNLGVIGYNALQVAERLRATGLAFQPDLVVYAYVLNDPQEISIELEALKDLRAAEERRFHEGLARGVLRWLSASRLFLWASSRWRVPDADAPRPHFRHGVDPAYAALRAGDARGEYFRALHQDPGSRLRLATGLDRLAATARAAGVPVFLALFPLLLERRDEPYPLADVHALVAEEARARGFDVLDLEPSFARGARARGGLDADFLHPNDQGHRLAAMALIEGLRAAGRLPDGALAAWQTEHFAEADLPVARLLGLAQDAGAVSR